MDETSESPRQTAQGDMRIDAARAAQLVENISNVTSRINAVSKGRPVSTNLRNEQLAIIPSSP